MGSKYAVFLIIGALIVMIFHSSSTNFVAALETNCYTFGQSAICIHTLDEYDPPRKALTYCDKDKNCTTTWGKETVMTPEIKNSLKNALQLSPDSLTQNSNPTLKNDNGIEVSPGLK